MYTLEKIPWKVAFFLKHNFLEIITFNNVCKRHAFVEKLENFVHSIYILK